ncbi:hypothetical protein [Nocardia cyriacigeorgica]|uniref:Uncharacterized protein n=1 Tax=Nocardia cyriacigeorgica TaxID=135487 RepID=A0A5R8NNV5_9NOCA|nr:hypothetical protein [Nocardia cyriacigeorgica]TLF77376.1 hypothetical protein FEK34_13565 [Nocardia cyriacigeorgica]
MKSDSDPSTDIGDFAAVTSISAINVCAFTTIQRSSQRAACTVSALGAAIFQKGLMPEYA